MEIRWLEKAFVFVILHLADFSWLLYKLGANWAVKTVKVGGSNFDVLSKQTQQWLWLSSWLQFTHTPLAGSAALRGPGRQHASSSLSTQAVLLFCHSTVWDKGKGGWKNKTYFMLGNKSTLVPWGLPSSCQPPSQFHKITMEMTKEWSFKNVELHVGLV